MQLAGFDPNVLLVSSRAWRNAIAVLVGTTLIAYVSSSVGADYRLLSETIYPTSSPAPRVYSLQYLSGGYLISGQAVSNQSWVIRTSNDGTKQWDLVIPGRRYSEQRAIFGLEANDGVRRRTKLLYYCTERRP